MKESEIKLGHAFGVLNKQVSRVDMLKAQLELSTAAVEVSFLDLNQCVEGVTDEEAELIQQFEYVSIHAPAGKKTKDGFEFLKIDQSNGAEVISAVNALAKQVHPQTILFHPDIIDDYQWLYQELGDLLAFENMDDNKDFGRTVEDMQSVFDQVPQAKFVCDVNHIYTNDSTMQLADEFHDAFADRLCHYHISAYRGWHHAFHEEPDNGELVILQKGIQKSGIPLIHEGGATKQEIAFLEKEYLFVNEELLKM